MFKSFLTSFYSTRCLFNANHKASTKRRKLCLFIYFSLSNDVRNRCPVFPIFASFSWLPRICQVMVDDSMEYHTDLYPVMKVYVKLTDFVCELKSRLNKKCSRSSGVERATKRLLNTDTKRRETPIQKSRF